MLRKPSDPRKGRILCLVPLWPDRAFEFILSRLKGGQFRPHIGDLLLDGAQFGLVPCYPASARNQASPLCKAQVDFLGL
jgi:hypothetical protein